MAEHQKNGGPAFPIQNAQFTEAYGGAPGMTLRDWFAGQAMHGIVGSIGSEEAYLRLRGHAQSEDLTVSQWIARDAYKQADAMLAERSKPEGRS